jgi:hypothetical protein
MMKTYRNYGDGVQYLRGLEHAAAGPVPRIDFVHATMMARHRARPMLREPVPGLCTNALGPTLRTDRLEMMFSHPAPMEMALHHSRPCVPFKKKNNSKSQLPEFIIIFLL